MDVSASFHKPHAQNTKFLTKVPARANVQPPIPTIWIAENSLGGIQTNAIAFVTCKVLLSRVAAKKTSTLTHASATVTNPVILIAGQMVY